MTDDQALNRGIDLFNRAHFFDAHEVLEDIWRATTKDRPLRRHLQGMVQLAVAFHHESRGNHLGARSVLARALRNLEGADESFPMLDLARLRAHLSDWQEYLAAARTRPEPPRISVRRSARQMLRRGETL